MGPASERVAFLIGGVQKGGTTALHDYLKRDLAVSMAHVKEAHFFDDEAINGRRPEYDAYHALFDPLDGRPRGEATPIYIYWPGCLERIAAYNPAMRFVFIFRDPVERAWSHWRMESTRGFDHAPFSWAIREGRERVAYNPDQPGYHRVFSYVERGFYSVQLARALSLFPRAQFLLLRSEDLQSDPDAVLRQVARHLSLPEPPVSVRPLNANIGEARALTGPSEDDRDHLASVYRADLRSFAALSGLEVSSWARGIAASAPMGGGLGRV